MTFRNALRNVAEAHLEAARACNLACGYCYEAERDHDDPPLMPLATAFYFIELVLERSACERVQFILHGGEPMLHTPEWVASVAEHAVRTAARRGKCAAIAMQSNCTLLDDPMLEVLEEFQVRVGTSLDGRPGTDGYRPDTGAVVGHAIGRLQAKGLLGGVICVMHPGNVLSLRPTLDYLHSLGVDSALITICRSVGRGSAVPPLTSDELLAGYRQLLEYLLDTRGKEIVEAFMADKVSRFLRPPGAEAYERELVCSHPLCGGGLTTLYCDTAGRLYPCGFAVADPSTCLGDVRSPDDTRHRESVYRMHAVHLERDGCGACQARGICSFGCAAVDPLDPVTADRDCEATRELYALLAVTERARLEEIAHNQARGRLE